MKKITFSAAAAVAASVSLYAAPEISISSSPALPTANLIQQSDFANGKIAPWVPNRVAPELISLDDGAIKITGDPGKSPNVYYRLNPAEDFKKGEPYYVSYRARRSGSGAKPDSGNAALCIEPFNSKSYLYIGVPDLPLYDYDWATFSRCGNILTDAKRGTIYLCYYKQDGAVWFDDLVIKYGTVDLNVNVKGGGLQSITVRNSITGTVLKESITGSEYSKTIKVPAFGSYSVEVFDRTGEVTSKLYPADEDSNVAASDTVIPVTPIKRLIIAGGVSDNFVFYLPEVKGKKIYLEFRARCDRAKGGPGGYTNALAAKVNGKALNINDVVTPGQKVTLKGKPQKVENIANRDGFVVFFSNAFMTIPESNYYFPTTYLNNNPWDFKLDITRAIESDALNMLDLKNINSNATLIMEDVRVVIE